MGNMARQNVARPRNHMVRFEKICITFHCVSYISCIMANYRCFGTCHAIYCLTFVCFCINMDLCLCSSFLYKFVVSCRPTLCIMWLCIQLKLAHVLCIYSVIKLLQIFMYVYFWINHLYIFAVYSSSTYV